MSTIKAGFNDKPLHIQVSSREDSRTAELWIVQDGLEDEVNPNRAQETLSYITLDELLDLRDELNTVINEIVR